MKGITGKRRNLNRASSCLCVVKSLEWYGWKLIADEVGHGAGARIGISGTNEQDLSL
jgi:hypothetical protein